MVLTYGNMQVWTKGGIWGFMMPTYLAKLRSRLTKHGNPIPYLLYKASLQPEKEVSAHLESSGQICNDLLTFGGHRDNLEVPPREMQMELMAFRSSRTDNNLLRRQPNQLSAIKVLDT